MADVTAREVKALRDTTGAGMMDAKKALVECDGDAEAASQLLRERGLAKAATRSDRDNVEGAVGLVSDGRRAALVHLKCETDFSAKSEGFLSLVDDLTNAVLAEGVGAIEARTAAIDDLRLSIKENIEVGRVDLIEVADGNALDTYLHVQDGRGVNGVVVEGSGVDQETLHQVALHIAFAKPTTLTRGRAGGSRAGRPVRDHPGRGQARAGLGQDRRGPSDRLVPGDRPAGAGAPR